MDLSKLRLQPIINELPTPPELIDHPAAALAKRLSESGLLKVVKPGHRVAVAVGSRGINALVPLVKTLVQALNERGADPFVLPAMGSHGGGTATGQRAFLAALGITEQSCSTRIVSSIEVADLGPLPGNGPRLVTSITALEADWVIPLARVKSHTAFKGEIESGLLKMVVVGLGKKEGAGSFHLHALREKFPELLVEFARGIMSHLRIPAGVAVLEDAKGRTACIEVVSPGEFEKTDRKLLALYKTIAPKLPLGEADLLIVERMGKDISGTGMDINVIGRSRGPLTPDPDWPRVARIWARNLTGLDQRGRGNANGVGLSDFISARLAARADMESTILNAMTALCPENAFLPPVIEPERRLLSEALRTAGVHEPGRARIAWIQDTGHIENFLASPSLARSLSDCAQVIPDGKTISFTFDSTGDLTSFNDHWQKAAR